MSSIEASRSGLKGLGMPGPNVTTGLPCIRTSNVPLRGFSLLISTETPGMFSFKRRSSLPARVLNTPHDLQCSISTTGPPFALLVALAAFAFAFVFACFAAGLALVLRTLALVLRTKTAAVAFAVGDDEEAGAFALVLLRGAIVFACFAAG
eukprot:CAMPEP_0197491316 /NCGR_PEP_ID=MMETSP1311-20131121/5618_1 /TAXON_ID=464262 /ORGANISM="Genus nov. species nov., Strain RCC856" /LENGTH=150 /DNA_ID=CAMNT_0043035967 /DNA_START=265 /DNA_END=713 /DNA_ORIENTATION=-